MARRKVVIKDLEFEVGPDVDLDVEPVQRADGARLTEEAAALLGAEIGARGRGRPSLTGQGRRSPHVSFRVTPQVRDQLAARAKTEGKSVSEVAREAVERYVS